MHEAEASVNKYAASTIAIIVTVILCAMVVSILIGVLITRSIVKPLQEAMGCRTSWRRGT